MVAGNTLRLCEGKRIFYIEDKASFTTGPDAIKLTLSKNYIIR